MYQISVVATGEVRDKDGNLISAAPLEATMVVDEETAQAFAEQAEPKDQP